MGLFDKGRGHNVESGKQGFQKTGTKIPGVPTSRAQAKAQAKESKEEAKRVAAAEKARKQTDKMLEQQKEMSLQRYGFLSPYTPAKIKYNARKNDPARIAFLDKLKENYLKYNAGGDKDSAAYKEFLDKIKDADKYDYFEAVLGRNTTEAHKRIKDRLNNTVMPYTKGHGGIFNINYSSLADVVGSFNTALGYEEAIAKITEKLTTLEDFNKYKMFNGLVEAIMPNRDAEVANELCSIYGKSYYMRGTRKELGASSYDAKRKIKKAFVETLTPYMRGWPSEGENYFLELTDNLVDILYS